jgi:hypothetical protein
MATVIELKYFNTFWLKKIKSITDVEPTALSGVSPEVTAFDSATRTITVAAQPADVTNVGTRNHHYLECFRYSNNI